METNDKEWLLEQTAQGSFVTHLTAPRFRVRIEIESGQVGVNYREFEWVDEKPADVVEWCLRAMRFYDEAQDC